MDAAAVKQAVGELEGGEAATVIWMWNRRGDPTRVSFETVAQARESLVHGCVAVGVARVDQDEGLPPVVASFSYVGPRAPVGLKARFVSERADAVEPIRASSHCFVDLGKVALTPSRDGDVPCAPLNHAILLATYRALHADAALDGIAPAPMSRRRDRHSVEGAAASGKTSTSPGTIRHASASMPVSPASSSSLSQRTARLRAAAAATAGMSPLAEPLSPVSSASLQARKSCSIGTSTSMRSRSRRPESIDRAPELDLSDPDLADAVARLHSDQSDTHWLVLGYRPRVIPVATRSRYDSQGAMDEEGGADSPKQREIGARTGQLIVLAEGSRPMAAMRAPASHGCNESVLAGLRRAGWGPAYVYAHVRHQDEHIAASASASSAAAGSLLKGTDWRRPGPRGIFVLVTHSPTSSEAAASDDSSVGAGGWQRFSTAARAVLRGRLTVVAHQQGVNAFLSHHTHVQGNGMGWAPGGPDDRCWSDSFLTAASMSWSTSGLHAIPVDEVQSAVSKLERPDRLTLAVELTSDGTGGSPAEAKTTQLRVRLPLGANVGALREALRAKLPHVRAGELLLYRHRRFTDVGQSKKLGARRSSFTMQDLVDVLRNDVVPIRQLLVGGETVFASHRLHQEADDDTADIGDGLEVVPVQGDDEEEADDEEEDADEEEEHEQAATVSDVRVIDTIPMTDISQVAAGAVATPTNKKKKSAPRARRLWHSAVKATTAMSLLSRSREAHASRVKRAMTNKKGGLVRRRDLDQLSSDATEEEKTQAGDEDEVDSVSDAINPLQPSMRHRMLASVLARNAAARSLAHRAAYGAATAAARGWHGTAASSSQKAKFVEVPSPPSPSSAPMPLASRSAASGGRPPRAGRPARTSGRSVSSGRAGPRGLMGPRGVMGPIARPGRPSRPANIVGNSGSSGMSELMRIAQERRERAAAAHEAKAAAQDTTSGIGRVVSGIAVAGSQLIPGAPSSNAAWLEELDAETAEREELKLRMAFREIPVMELEMLGTLGQGITAVVRHARWWHDDNEGDQTGVSTRSLGTRSAVRQQHPDAVTDAGVDTDVDARGDTEADVDVEERAMTEVAVKEFTAASASARPPAQVQAFMRELAALHRVPPHPNLVQVLGACTHPQLRLVIEYMPFGDLFGAIRSSSPPDFLTEEEETGRDDSDPAAKLIGPGGVAMTLRTRVRLAQDIAAGLAHLHDCNRVHRDLKCHNILLDVSGSQLRAKLGDFGTTLMLDEWRTDVASKSAGTRGYVAPELLISPEPATLTPSPTPTPTPTPSPTGTLAAQPAVCVVASRSAAVDIFALGVVMWELMAEDPEWGNPLKGIADDALVARLKEGQSPPLDDKVPESYRVLVRKCWSFHASHRPTAKQVAATLNDLLDRLE